MLQGVPTFRAKVDLPSYIRVKVTTDQTSPATVDIAGDSDATIGMTYDECKAGDLIAVRLVFDQGIQQGIASGAIVNADVLYAAADGKISATGTTPIHAIAVESCGNDEMFNFIFTNGVIINA